MPTDAAGLLAHIRDVPDYPEPGIVFRDITPLLADAAAFAAAVDMIVAQLPTGERIDKVVGIEARGFIVAAPVAIRLGVGFVPVRKAGKLPGPTLAATYALEYGEATIEVHADAFTPGDRVLVVDDVLATGGTVAATADLLCRAGAQTAAVSVLIDLDALGGRKRLAAALPGVVVRAVLDL